MTTEPDPAAHPAPGAAARASAKRFLIYWLPVILYSLAIFVQSSFPSQVRPPGIPMADKVLHAAGYALLAALVFRAAAARPQTSLSRAWMWSVLFASIYGALDEFHQSFVPSRSADAADILADAAGALLGAGICRWIVPRMAGRLQRKHRLTTLRSSFK